MLDSRKREEDFSGRFLIGPLVVDDRWHFNFIEVFRIGCFLSGRLISFNIPNNNNEIVGNLQTENASNLHACMQRM